MSDRARTGAGLPVAVTRSAGGRSLSPQESALLDREIQADLGGFGRIDRDTFDEAVTGLDAVRPHLDAILADWNGVAGEALAVGAVAAGFLVAVGVLDIGAGLQRLAVGGDLDPDRAAGDLQALAGGFTRFDHDVVDELIRRADAIGPDLD